MNTNKSIKELFNNFGIKISKEQEKKFTTVIEILLSWKSKINLTSLDLKSDIVDKHLIDSAAALKYIDVSQYKTAIDIGTGAGFPGIVIGILRQDLEVTLLEATRKKTDYLNILVSEIKNTNIKVINARAEEYVIKAREQFDIAMFRALGKLPYSFELAAPFVKLNGLLIYYCREKQILEYNFSSIFGELGCRQNRLVKYSPDSGKSKNNILIVDKMWKTPAKYPRNTAAIKNRPIG